ncbi:class C sortase [Bifidobacterium aemilianum]|uniref:Class C sortase n=2 Tax=Bifidobacterium aemilianum TaxID=2493120 RepID=A0A366K6H3_9BIFI|nr:class C sortase [Bifidobacterium aemilianum]
MPVFAEYMDVPSFSSFFSGGVVDRQEVQRRRVNMLFRVLIFLFSLMSVAVVVWIPVVQYVHGQEQAARSAAANQAVQSWPTAKVAGQLHAAEDYNRQIADSKQELLGEASDPFQPAGTQGPTLSEKDGRYQRLLDAGDGVMGTIRIPKVSIDMPIYHGTSEFALASGAGHLYGSSLPVGGASTNAVISGHRGLTNALMFTRLDELKEGDTFYIQTLGRTMGYQIESIHVIDPDDVHLYKVRPGKDLVTLMTCTPYGVNTQRLVLTAARKSMPGSIPEPAQAPKDALLPAVAVGAVVAFGGFLVLSIQNLLRLPPRHGSRLVSESLPRSYA